jgi:arylsulfatase A-like enzyme
VLKRAGYRTMTVISHEFAGCKYSGCRGFDVVSDATPKPEPTAKTVARTLALLDAQADREPFFLWLHVRVPHAPYDAGPERFMRMYGDAPGPTVFSSEVHAPTFFALLSNLSAHYRAAGEPIEPMRVMTGRHVETTPTVVRQLWALYDANVRSGDDAFGRILSRLKRRGWLRRSIVVVAADHGEALGEHGIMGHNKLWHGMLHTPLVVHVPGGGGRRIAAPVMNVDVLPTIAKLVGAPLAKPVRGRDLFESRGPDELQFAEYVPDYVVVRRRQKLWVFSGSTSKLRPKGGAGARQAPAGQPFEIATEPRVRPRGLWDLAADPTEQKELVAERPGQVAELQALGEQLRASRLDDGTRRPSEDVFDRLRALGYIEHDHADDR